MNNNIFTRINRCGGYLILSLLFGLIAFFVPKIADKLIFVFMASGFAINFFSELFKKYEMLSAMAFVFNSILFGLAGYFLFIKYCFNDWFNDAPAISRVFFIALVAVIELVSLYFFLLSIINLCKNIKKKYLTRQFPSDG